ncbi:sulfotransferase family protein [Solemya elarraichensis gill symbiont]|uniref:Sulfotransferase family protein n=1 Tax=Solemya elarraichensis gill symbiont TaxID=1918949 RepID=A0A1T2KUZ5_9GAMM|nr:sulfotransferase family protein [Solemya elarraichensis gill symbiont]OOZ36621.1 hypothetical protein BOW52_10670 [Solemya elarraichensis gill symbiont]
MYIFNIGLNRSGTTSLSRALDMLNFPTLHHHIKLPKENGEIQKIRLVDLWRHNIQNNRRPFSGLDHKFFSFSDFFGEGCFKMLDATYKDSKFILTIRNLDSWLESRERKVNKNLQNPNYIGGFTRIDRPAWTETYHRHRSSVKLHFADHPEKLLILNIPGGDGWECLCPFLGVDIPNVPFPHKNRLKPYA